MNVVSAVDDFLIDRVFQRGADAVARWMTPAGVAEFLMMGCATCYIGWSVVAPSFAMLLGAAMNIAACAYLILVIRAEERKARDGMMPSARLELVGWRIVAWIFLCLMPGKLADWLMEDNVAAGFRAANDSLFWAAGYFVACRRNPPPPKRETAADLALGGVS